MVDVMDKACDISAMNHSTQTSSAVHNLGLPPELEKHCLKFIPCRGVTEERLARVRLSTLSQAALITRKLRPWFGRKFTSPSGDAYIISEQSKVVTCMTYWSPLGGCWFPIASRYIGDGEYRSLCIHKNGNWICEWEREKEHSVWHSDLIFWFIHSA